jgi:hypothetical protein
MAIMLNLRMPTNLPDPWKRRRPWSDVGTFIEAMAAMLIGWAVIMWSVWSAI